MRNITTFLTSISSIAVFLLPLFYSVIAEAQTLSCRDNGLGTTTCRSSDGTTYRSRDNGLGTTTIRGSDGTTVRCRDNGLGTTTCR